MRSALNPTYTYAATTREGRVERATHVLRNEPGDKTDKVTALRKHFAITDTELRDALKAAKPRPAIQPQRTFTSEF